MESTLLTSVIHTVAHVRSSVVFSKHSVRTIFFLLLWLVKSFKNRIVDHLEKCGLFFYFQYGFRSSRSTADLHTVVCDRIARAFNRSGAT